MQNPDMVRLLKELMAIDFVVYELGLFLDTHPNCQKALEDHNKMVRRSEQLTAAYEQRFGPLSINSQSQFPYQYICEPWPWEIRY